MEEQIRKAGVLIEALPYLQRFRDQIFLIKVGGSAMDDPQLVRNLLRDIVFLEVVGVRPVLVHGGGKAISRAMAGAGLEARFVGGLRVTDADSISIVEKT
ncbi:MAG: acetylglutamate kinase, partial [Verrucomicrobiota bacterium]